jgi:succinate-semialdehyde dehydrogenase/glutarate-semialdehyde dehydrogenase
MPIKSSTSSATPQGVASSDLRLFHQAAYIDGRWIEARAGESTPVDNPATGETLGVVPNLHVSDARNAIDAAARAFTTWRATTAKSRAAILRRWFDLMIANQEDLARLVTLEQGKPLAEAKSEVVYAASFLEWFGEEGKRVYGDTIPTHDSDKRLFVLKEPVGVVGCITPWNFPLAMITRKAGPAIAAGCTVVLKPAPQTPFSALALAELAERAGIPRGVFNVVTGDAAAIGGELTSNPIVRKLSFTGSTPVGRLLMGQSAATVKKLSLELGGNAPFIVFDDADIDAAVEGAIAAKFRNTGQTCICANRFLVQDTAYDAFTTKLSKTVGQLKVGSGLEPNVVQGPLIEDRAVEKVERHIADATAKGARILVGGRRHERGGRFFQPTVLAGVTSEMQISQEETFGPVAPITAFETEAEAIALANATEYGLAAYFYGRDLSRVWRVAEALEYGLVGVNTGAMSTEIAPFGGYKQSGLGREGSKYGIDEFLEIKYVCVGNIGTTPR